MPPLSDLLVAAIIVIAVLQLARSKCISDTAWALLCCGLLFAGADAKPDKMIPDTPTAWLIVAALVVLFIAQQIGLGYQRRRDQKPGV